MGLCRILRNTHALASRLKIILSPNLKHRNFLFGITSSITLSIPVVIICCLNAGRFVKHHVSTWGWPFDLVQRGTESGFFADQCCRQIASHQQPLSRLVCHHYPLSYGWLSICCVPATATKLLPFVSRQSCCSNASHLQLLSLLVCHHRLLLSAAIILSYGWLSSCSTQWSLPHYSIDESA